MSIYKTVFDENIKRVNGLLALYVRLKEDNERDSRDYKLTDLLRTAVVFLHSSFEEYFRTVLMQWLPQKAGEEVLKQIPISLKAGKRNEKILLSDLSNYRGKTIDEIINESIVEHLKLTSFNSQGDIVSWCRKIGIEIDSQQALSDIDKAVARRHKIVHEADTNRSTTSENGRLQGIKPGDIYPWISAYCDIVNNIEAMLNKWEAEHVPPNS